MALSLSRFLSTLCQSVEHAVHDTTRHTVGSAKRAPEELGCEIDIAGQPLKVEGAANLPNSSMRPSEVTLQTKAYLEEDEDGDMWVHLKNGLFRKLPEIDVEVSFEATNPLESLELARERANEVNREHINDHRARVAKQEKDDGRAKQ